MSGIYIHIPFCKQACHYCDFHFSTNTSRLEEMVDAICGELGGRKSYLPQESPVQTVYFGGGTPSLLDEAQIDRILQTIAKHYWLDVQEVTLESNPDDLNPEKLSAYKRLGIDRLSIGIQSFDAAVLKFYNRSHSAEESVRAIEMAKKAGFDKLSIDLIYGFPSTDHRIWEQDLETALREDPGHISSYCLTVEPKTVLGNWAEKGKFRPAGEDFAAEQFELLQATMESADYIQYEISNFGKKDAFAIHNSNYWKGIPYLGIGPSAHSFDGQNRGANIAHNAEYLKLLKNGQSPFNIDNLSPEDLLNEYLLTSLRTIWGTDLKVVKDRFQVDLMLVKKQMLHRLREEALIMIENEHIYLTKTGKLLADSIAASLFIP